MPRRSVITLAFGKPYYLELATALARSFRLWHQKSAISFTIVTDLDVSLPADLDWAVCKRLPPGRFGSGFTSKLHLDSFSEGDANLFIDSDCLVYGHLGPIFERWEGRPFALVGDMISEGEYFGDVRERCDSFGVPAIPRFIGSIYFWSPGKRAEEIFVSARAMAERYDSLGFRRLRGMPNEEPLLSVALAKSGLGADPDDGAFKADAIAYRRIIRADVTAGVPHLENPDPETLGYPTWLHLRTAQPLIIHFNDSYAQQPPYSREALRLRLLCFWPSMVAGSVSWALVSLPFMVTRLTKSILRPAYAVFFGVRRIRPSPRL